MRFKVLVDFDWPALRSRYVAGLSYSVTEQNEPFLDAWIQKGLIELTPASTAKVQGVGTVS